MSNGLHSRTSVNCFDSVHLFSQTGGWMQGTTFSSDCHIFHFKTYHPSATLLQGNAFNPIPIQEWNRPVDLQLTALDLQLTALTTTYICLARHPYSRARCKHLHLYTFTYTQQMSAIWPSFYIFTYITDLAKRPVLDLHFICHSYSCQLFPKLLIFCLVANTIQQLHHVCQLLRLLCYHIDILLCHIGIPMYHISQ